MGVISMSLVLFDLYETGGVAVACDVHFPSAQSTPENSLGLKLGLEGLPEIGVYRPQLDRQGVNDEGVCGAGTQRGQILRGPDHVPGGSVIQTVYMFGKAGDGDGI